MQKNMFPSLMPMNMLSNLMQLGLHKGSVRMHICKAEQNNCTNAPCSKHECVFKPLLLCLVKGKNVSANMCSVLFNITITGIVAIK